MLKAAFKQKLMSAIEREEGRIRHMYLCSNGYVTVGVGHKVASLAAAQALAFQTKTGTKASNEQVKTDYEAVSKMQKNLLASKYESATKLVLSEAEIDRLAGEHVDSFHSGLKGIYGGFDSFPEPVRLALFDMIYNLGKTGLRDGYPKMNAAIALEDWAEAAKQSRRKPPVAERRNKYVKQLFEKAAAQAAAKKP